jgi:membrane associated rhomboid family serine protease
VLLQVNMLALYSVGPAVEGTLGGNRFLLCIYMRWPTALHLLVLLQVNMLALYNVGPAVEGTLGGNRFLALYLGSAVGGNLLSCMLGSGFSSSMGSSGAVFEVILMTRYLTGTCWLK